MRIPYRTIAARRPAGRILLVALAVLLVLVAIWLLDHLARGMRTSRRAAGAVTAALVTEEDPPIPHVRISSVQLRADTGLVLNLRVVRPALIDEPLPLMVLIGGHRTGRDAVALVGDPGPVVVAALDYPFHGEERIRGIGHAFMNLRASSRRCSTRRRRCRWR